MTFFLTASGIGSAWMALCWCGSTLISQTADRRLNWVIASWMPSHSRMGFPKVLSWVPCFFTLYITPLQPYNFQFHCYPSSLCRWHQNIYSTWLQGLRFSIAELRECLACFQKWMDGVRLKLNPEKTEFTVLGNRQAREFLVQKFPTQFLGNSPLPMKFRI